MRYSALIEALSALPTIRADVERLEAFLAEPPDAEQDRAYTDAWEVMAYRWAREGLALLGLDLSLDGGLWEAERTMRAQLTTSTRVGDPTLAASTLLNQIGRALPSQNPGAPRHAPATLLQVLEGSGRGRPTRGDRAEVLSERIRPRVSARQVAAYDAAAEAAGLDRDAWIRLHLDRAAGLTE